MNRHVLRYRLGVVANTAFWVIALAYCFAVLWAIVVIATAIAGEH